MANQAAFPVRAQCRVLDVSASGYYAWLKWPPSARALRNTALSEGIRDIHSESDATYGMSKVRAELVAQGETISRKLVAKLMQRASLQGVSRRRGFVVTTQRDTNNPKAPDLVQRQFQAQAPNQLWVADMSAPCRRGLQRQEKGEQGVSKSSWLIHDRQLQCCLAPVGAGRKGAAKLGRLPTVGCHAQSSLNCTERGFRAAGRATAGSMVRQRSGRRTPLYSATPRPRDGHRGVIRLGLMFPSGGCAQRTRRWVPHSAIVQSHQG